MSYSYFSMTFILVFLYFHSNNYTSIVILLKKSQGMYTA